MTASPLDEVAKLMDERAKFEAFLVELDKGGGDKPEHVVAKVKADYTKKLTEVVEKLKANHSMLTEHAATLSESLKKLEAEEKQVVDEQSESEVRKQVGELSDSDWLVQHKKAEARLIKLREQQQLTSGDINRIRGILGEASKKATPKSTPATEPAKTVTDELAFLKSVVGSTGNLPQAAKPAPPPRTSQATPVQRPSGQVPKPTPPPAPPPATPTPASPHTAIRPSVVRSSLIEPDPMDVEVPPKPAPEPVKPVARPTPPKESLIDKPQADVKIGAAEGKPLAANVPDGDMQLKARGIQGGGKKTLKCKECGTLNNPAEWYCERCGAELAQI